MHGLNFNTSNVMYVSENSSESSLGEKAKVMNDPISLNSPEMTYLQPRDEIISDNQTRATISEMANVQAHKNDCETANDQVPEDYKRRCWDQIPGQNKTLLEKLVGYLQPLFPFYEYVRHDVRTAYTLSILENVCTYVLIEISICCSLIKTNYINVPN